MKELMKKYSMDIEQMMHLAFIYDLSYAKCKDLELVEKCIKLNLGIINE